MEKTSNTETADGGGTSHLRPRAPSPSPRRIPARGSSLAGTVEADMRQGYYSSPVGEEWTERFSTGPDFRRWPGQNAKGIMFLC